MLEKAREKYFLTYSEFSQYLNISKPSIEELLIKNGCPFYKVGTKYLFKRVEIDEFLNDITEGMNNRNNDIKIFTKLNKTADKRLLNAF